MSELHPQAAALLRQLAALSDGTAPTLEGERAQYREVPALSGSPEPVFQITNQQIKVDDRTIPVRIYRPDAPAPLPILVYAHGGSFIGGDLHSHDPPLRSLANRAACLIIAVDYHLAPEHPFPQGLEDVYAVVLWAAQHAEELGGNAQALAVGGDSAGGNLAAATTLLARERGQPVIRFQLLLYPNTDLTLRSQSWRTHDGILLTKSGMATNITRYLASKVEPSHHLVSPVFASDLRGLPPAFIAVGTHDPLYDEIVAYADQLKQTGVPVTLQIYPGMIHGFFQMAGVLDDARKLIDDSAEALRQGLQLEAKDS
jgi:acetyl esterase